MAIFINQIKLPLWGLLIFPHERTDEMTHALKIEHEYFEDIVKGLKTFEVRKNDRNFRLNDILALNECRRGTYTGRCILVSVGYILDEKTAVLENTGLVVMGIVPLDVAVRLKYPVPVYGRKEPPE